MIHDPSYPFKFINKIILLYWILYLTKSYIGEDLIKNLKLKNYRVTTIPTVMLANGRTVKIEKIYHLKYVINDQTFSHDFLFLPGLLQPILFGMDLIKRHIDCTIKIIEGSVSVVNQIEIDNNITEDEKINDLLEEIRRNLAGVKGKTTLIEHEIKLVSKDPIKQRYYPVNPALQQIMNEETDKMLNEGVIEPSNSPYSSPVVLVKKPDGKRRFCIDFRKINDISEKDAYPLPYISSILDKLQNSRYFTTLDLKNGFWQIPLSKESRPITAFTVPGRGLFQFTVMPFGLHSAPATFQRLLDTLLGHEFEGKAFAYIDDVIILGKNLDDHIKNIRQVLQRLQEANLKLNLDKCQFCKTSIKYLGHIISEKGVETDPERIKAIKIIKAPENVKQLRRFLGITSWYRRFVPSFSKITLPLTMLLKKNQKWVWSEDQNKAFRTLKNCLVKSPILTCPDFSKTFTLQTDASDSGIGVALTQEFDKQERVIAYASRTLSKNEKNYTVTEKECLAVIWGINKMKMYLEGYKFKVMTDHYSLKWIRTLQNPSGRLARWALLL